MTKIEEQAIIDHAAKCEEQANLAGVEMGKLLEGSWEDLSAEEVSKRQEQFNQLMLHSEKYWAACSAIRELMQLLNI